MTDSPSLSRRGFFAVVLGAVVPGIVLSRSREDWQLFQMYGNVRLLPDGGVVRVADWRPRR